MKRIEQRGLYFDELQTDVLYVHTPGRTMTEADNVLFTTMTMNTQGLHLDEVFASAQPLGKRVMNSMFTLATMVGQSVTQLTQGTIVGQLGLAKITFPHPLYPGDTLTTETTVVALRPSKSKPGLGIATFAHTGRNQHGTVVATAERSCLMFTAEAHRAAAASQKLV
ncbi:MaoC family dehydratase [Glutamicibacter uratoxydans]|uniref:MaoC family dehydratase n=1 Tax=Glutamicibacter uratoxydans TaxID=43667 RepID=UPI003D6F5E92